MIAVVPRPGSVAVGAGRGAGIAFADGTPIVLDDPALADMARRFADDVARDGSVTLRVQDPSGAERPSGGGGGGEAGDGGDGAGARVGATIRLVLAPGAGAVGGAPSDGAPASRGADPGGVDPGGVGPDGAGPGGAASATIGVSPAGSDPADERYHLVVDDGGATVRAGAPEGLWRGLTTLRQLLATAPRRAGTPVVAAVEVHDAPRFAWRGLSLDVVRSFFGPDEVKRVIDVLSLYKLNVLHLHLTDDQGWRIEIPGRPALTDVGGKGAVGDRPGGFFTQAEFAEVVGYAAERFVTVVPEIDLPGHAAAAIAAHPELSARAVGHGVAGRPVNVLDPDHPGVLDFAGEVIGALAAATPGPYLHIGGDEAAGLSPDAYRRFVDAARGFVLAAGKRPVAWQEAACTGVGPSDVVQHWLAFGEAVESLLLSGGAPLGTLEHLELPDGVDLLVELLPVIAEALRNGRADLAAAVERGARVLLSPASHLYLDRPYAESPTEPDQQAWRDRLGLSVYPRMTVEETFAWDPTGTLDLPDEAFAGVEAAVWCETIETVDELEFMLLPRLAGVAERAWSAPPVSAWDQFRPRLGAQSTIWAARGWRYFTSSLVAWARPA